VTLLLRHKIYLFLATAILVVQLVVAATVKPSFRLTVFGDSVPIALLLLAALSVFWKVFSGGFAAMSLSQAYWYYYDWRRIVSTPSPVPGDALFIVAHVFFLSALSLRPHSSFAGRDIRTRSLDFLVLLAWWLSLFCYFSLPWQLLLHDLQNYTPSCYFLSLIQHIAIIASVVVLSIRKTAIWRKFYLLVTVAFTLIAGGNLLLNMAIDRGVYYAGSFYDTPFVLGLYLFTLIAGLGPSLHPTEDTTPNRELFQSVWTARIAMLSVLSLPFLALLGLYQTAIPAVIAAFRLKFVFEATFVLGILVYMKLSLLARELVRSVKLTHDSIENLKSVHQQVVHSEKFIALGRLAAGAAHEISNPLTAILGYSELLTDIPSLTADDRENARSIQQQVHRAQAAVTSLRNVLRQKSASALAVDKKPSS
jgi:His Kinase A (phospho-acceptor) domain